MALSHGMDTNHKTHVASQRETNETQCSKSWPVQTKETAYSGIVVYCGHLPCSIHWHRSSTRSRMRRLAGFPQFGLLIPKMAVSRHISVQCTDCGPRRGFLKQAMRLYGDSQCADDIRPWTLLDKGKDGFHPIPLKINNTPGSHFFLPIPSTMVTMVSGEWTPSWTILGAISSWETS